MKTKKTQSVLCGDIGGTNTRLAVYEGKGDILKIVRMERYRSQEFNGLDAVIREFLKNEKRKIRSACFGIAGPVLKNKCIATNLPWVIDGDKLEKAFKLDHVTLINDLESFAYGLAMVKSKDLITIQDAKRRLPGNAALIAPGTGLGEAILYWDGKGYYPFATEGGHVNFGPRGPLQGALLQWMEKNHNHVSWERFLAGPGIHTLYQFLREYRNYKEPAWLTEKLAQGGAPQSIFELGAANKCPICKETLELFVELYASEAANLALKSMALGGVYLGGRITRGIQDRLNSEHFREAFLHKGRMRAVLENMPLKIITREGTPLDGAAWFAAFGKTGFSLK